MAERRYLAGVVQLCSGEDVERNTEAAASQIRVAAARGARLVVVPENFAFVRVDKRTPQPILGPDHPTVRAMVALAAELRVDLVLGSIPTRSETPGKVYNTSVYIDSGGKVRGEYRKMHLFDIDIPGGVTLKESDHNAPGDEPCLVDGDLGAIGLSICYDLRFPELYRSLTARGARVLTVPAAFTLHTGKDHWLPLLRARAIENQTYVLAAGQWGNAGDGPKTYGKSAIVDPWGLTLAIAAEGVGVAVAEIDYDRQDEIRRGLPCAEHRHRKFWPEGR